MWDFLDKACRKVFGSFGECLPTISDPMPEEHIYIQRERARIAGEMERDVQKVCDYINGITTRPTKVSLEKPPVIRDPVPDLSFGLWI